MADKAKITAKENVFSLELSGVQSGDSGQYSCRVTDGNQVTITCSANLEVHGRKFKIDLLVATTLGVFLLADPIFSYKYNQYVLKHTI